MMRNSTYFEGAAGGFMIDPNNFVLETLTEQRNKNVSIKLIITTIMLFILS